MSAEEVELDVDSISAKRPAEDVVEPEPKRARATGTVEQMISEVSESLGSSELGVPWSASLRELLLSLAPAALAAVQGQRHGNDELMLRMLDEIFAGEESLRKTKAEDSQAHVDVLGTKKAKVEAAVEEVEKDLKEAVDEAKEKLGVLPDDVRLVWDAETKFRQSMQEVLTQQRDTALGVTKDCFESLKDGSCADEGEKQNHLAALLPLLKQSIEDSSLCSTSATMLAKKPEERTSFDGAVMKQLEEAFEKRMAALEAQCNSAKAAVSAQAEAAPVAEEIKFEQAEAMLKQAKQMELARERTMTAEARSGSFELLKKGIDAPGKQRKHLAVLKKACRKIPDSKSLVAKFPAAFQKKPEARGEDSDNKVIQQLGEALDKRIASLEEQLDEEAAAGEAERKKVAGDLNAVKHSVEFDTEQRESKQQALTKERDNLVKLKQEGFEPLKLGTWETPAAPKPLLTSLKKLFKVLDIDNDTAGPITAVFKKKPAERGSFDAVLVQQCEDSIDKRVAAFDQQLSNIDAVGKYTTVRTAVEAADAAQEALEDARESQRDRLQEAVSAANQRSRLEETLEKKRNAVNEMMEDEKTAQATHAEKQKLLEQLSKARDSLAFLRERAEGETAN